MFTVSPHGPEYEDLREWLKDAREASGLTIRQAAEQLGVHHSILGKVESADRKLDLFEFINYCEVLRVSPEDFLKKIK